MSGFVPTPDALAQWAEWRDEQKRQATAILAGLNEHKDWYHDGNGNSAGCVDCSWVDGPTDIADAPRKFREHQARMILLELDAA